MPAGVVLTSRPLLVGRQGIYQLVYEQAKRAFDAEGSTPRTVASTLVAGSVAAATTAPIDLVKVRYRPRVHNIVP